MQWNSSATPCKSVNCNSFKPCEAGYLGRRFAPTLLIPFSANYHFILQILSEVIMDIISNTSVLFLFKRISNPQLFKHSKLGN